MTLFLATTDATIISTSLPKIAADLDASSTEYTWIGVAYLLTQTSCQPLYGKLSDFLGRKLVLYTSMLIFTIGSLLCGSAKTASWLVAARGVAGVGGGGIVSCIWTLTSELVEEQDRAKWSQALSITWSASAVAGPVLGGIFSKDSEGSILSWRWAFWINLPVCLVAFTILATSLRGIECGFVPDASFRKFLQKFDFLGLLLLMIGSTCLILGLSLVGQLGWTSPITLTNMIVGIVVLAVACIYESKMTTKDPVLPPKLFRKLTTCTILLIAFLHNVVFNAGTFYLTVFFQLVKNCTPFDAGIRTLPYSLGSSLATVPAAWVITYFQRRTGSTTGQIVVIRTGLAISTLGFGLMIMMDESSPLVAQILFQMLSGIGIGMLFHAPYQVFLIALDKTEIAIGTSGFFLCRFTGATLGLAVAGTVFQLHLLQHVPQGFSGGSIDLNTLEDLAPEIRSQIAHPIASAIRAIWIVCTPCIGVAFLLSFLARTTSQKCNAIHQDDKTTSESNSDLDSTNKV